MEEKPAELPVTPQEIQIQSPSFWGKIKVHKFKILGGILGVFVFVGAVFGAYKFGQRQVQPSGLVATPTPLPSESANLAENEGDLTANWKTYTNNGHSFAFRYPSSWNYKAVPNFPDTILFSPEEIVFAENSEGPITPVSVSIKRGVNIEKAVNTIKEAYRYKDFKERDIVVGGVNCRKISGIVTAESYITGKFNSQVFIPHNGEIINFSYTEETARVNEQIFDLMLSSFRFLDQKQVLATPTPKPVKVLSYNVPAGWQTVRDVTGAFEVGFNPADTKSETLSERSIYLYKLRPDPKYGYASFMSVRLLPYNGGSRHQFIYSQIGEKPRPDDLTPQYKEVEYVYNNHSCLFLVGISISQFPTVWGMCDAGNHQAFLITSYDPENFETTVSTIKVLK